MIIHVTSEELRHLAGLIEGEEEYAIFKDEDASFYTSLLAAFEMAEEEKESEKLEDFDTLFPRCTFCQEEKVIVHHGEFGCGAMLISEKLLGRREEE